MPEPEDVTFEELTQSDLALARIGSLIEDRVAKLRHDQHFGDFKFQNARLQEALLLQSGLKDICASIDTAGEEVELDGLGNVDPCNVCGAEAGFDRVANTVTLVHRRGCSEVVASPPVIHSGNHG